MKRTYGKLIALLLVLVMAVGMIPAAFAADFDSLSGITEIEKDIAYSFSTKNDTDHEIKSVSVSPSGILTAAKDTTDKTGHTLTIKGTKVGDAEVKVTYKNGDIQARSFRVVSTDVKVTITATAASDSYISSSDKSETYIINMKKDQDVDVQFTQKAQWGTVSESDYKEPVVTWTSSNSDVVFVSPTTGAGQIRSIPGKSAPVTITVTVKLFLKTNTSTTKADREAKASIILDVRNNTIAAVKSVENPFDGSDNQHKFILKDTDKDEDLIAQIASLKFKCTLDDEDETVVELPLLQNIGKEKNIEVSDKTDKSAIKFSAKLNNYDSAKNIEYDLTAVSNGVLSIVGMVPKTVFKSQPEDKTVELGQAMGSLSAMIQLDSGTIKSIKWYGVDNEDSTKTNFVYEEKDIGSVTSFLTTLNLNDHIKQPGKYPFFCVVEYTGGEERSKIAIVTVTGQYKIELTMPQTTVTVGQNLNVTATIKTYDANATTADKYVAYNGKDNITWTVSETKLLSIKNSITTSGASQTLTAKATENGNDKVVRVTVRANIDGKDLTAEKDITIKAAVADDIKLVVKDSADVAFTEVPDKLTTLVRAKTNNVSPNYIRIQTPDYGTLYTTTSKSARAEANRDYTLTELGRFCLNANMDHATNTIQYVAYNADGAIAKGKIVVSTTANRIEYYLNTGEYVTFNRMDFYQMFHDAYASDSMQYVTFDITADDKLDTTRNGYLRTNTSQASATVAANTQCFYAPASNAQALGTVTYYSGTSTAKYVITIPFKAFGRTATSGTNEMEGNVIIYVNYSKTIKTTSIGASFLSESVASKLLPDGVNASDAASYYVQFEKPSSGKMYENYRTYVGATPLTESVFTSNRYYLATNGSEKTISILYYLPKADVYKATLAYKIYKTDSSTPVDEGSLTFEIEKQTSSKYFTRDTNAKDSGAWASNAVDFAYANSLVNGVGTSAFGPEQNMPRAMLVTILYRAAGSPSVAAVTNPFKDLKKGAYYEDAVLWAYSRGVVNGSSPTTFNPDGRITRQDIAAILYRASGSPSTSGSLAGFGDATSVSSYAENAMRWAVQNGIITGTTVKNVYMLNPTGYATRAQVVVMLHRYLTQ